VGERDRLRVRIDGTVERSMIAAVAAAVAREGGGRIELGPGVYELSGGPLELPRGVQLEGGYADADRRQGPS
jgi:hypothetical protein